MYGLPDCETVEKWWSPVSGLFFSEFWACWTVGTLTPYLEVHQYRGASSAQFHSVCLREGVSVWLRSYHIWSCVAAVFRFIYDANAYTRRVLKQFWQNVDHIELPRFITCCHNLRFIYDANAYMRRVLTQLGRIQTHYATTHRVLGAREFLPSPMYYT